MIGHHLGVRASFCTICLVSRRFYDITQTFLHSPLGSDLIWRLGIALQLGLDGVAVSEIQGQLLIEVAATYGSQVADAYCDLEGWQQKRKRQLREPDHGRAMKTLRRDAEQTRNKWSVFLVGYCLYHGYGEKDTDDEKPNHFAAIEWYQRAVKNHALCVAQNHYALMLLDVVEGTAERAVSEEVLLAAASGETAENLFEYATRLLHEAAMQGNCRARYGWAMRNEDIPDSLMFFEFTEEEEHYYQEQEQGQDQELSRHQRSWWSDTLCVQQMHDSAMQGHDEALYELGLYSLYKYRQYQKSADWSRYREQGQDQELSRHQRCWSSDTLCVQQMHDSAMQGHDEALYELGLYSHYMQLADNKGHAVAACHVALAMEKVGKKHAAFDCYQKSAKMNVVRAMYCLGGYYIYGMGPVVADPAIALAWYTKAARLGHVQAATDAQVLVDAGVTLN